jgi:hypothetical protein
MAVVPKSNRRLEVCINGQEFGFDFNSPEGTADLDRLEADSKFFRSFSVLALAVVIEIGWDEPTNKNGELSIGVAAIIFSLWRYCDLRQKMVRACYLYYVQLHSERANQRSKAQGSA